MESEILQEIETIRGYIFVMMCAVVLWVIFKVLESAENVFIGFKKAWDTDFKNRMGKYQDSGKFEEIINECKEKLEKYQNHIDAVWFIAIAYYYTETQRKMKMLRIILKKLFIWLHHGKRAQAHTLRN